MSGYFDIMQVCLKGHQITANYNGSPELRQTRCEKCGAKTIHKCLKCGEYIRGHYYVPGVIDLCETKIPLYCHNCGKAYPWARRIKIEKMLRMPAWMKNMARWIGKNLIKVVVSVSIAVLSAFIIWKLGIQQ